MYNKTRVGALVVGALIALVVTGSTFKARAEDEAGEIKVALPVEQAIASIRTAVTAKPGRVLEVEAERENGKTLCEVKVLANDGKTYEVEVDVATNKVVEVELDDDSKSDD